MKVKRLAKKMEQCTNVRESEGACGQVNLLVRCVLSLFTVAVAIAGAFYGQQVVETKFAAWWCGVGTLTVVHLLNILTWGR